MDPSPSQPPSPHPRIASLAPPRSAPPRPSSSTLDAPFEPTARSSPSASHSVTTAIAAPTALDHPPFAPLFTLVEDARARTPTAHPAVHYVFAGDDPAPRPDPVLDALLRLNGVASAPGSPPAERERAAATSNARAAKGAEQARERERERARKEGGAVRERYVLVTLDATGRAVEAAHSLTPDWQVLGAEVGPAPMLEGGGAGGLMLKIEGTEGWGAERKGKGDLEGAGEEEEEEEEDRLEALVEDYTARMEELQKILGKAEGLEVMEEEPPDEGEETA